MHMHVWVCEVEWFFLFLKKNMFANIVHIVARQLLSEIFCMNVQSTTHNSSLQHIHTYMKSIDTHTHSKHIRKS